MADSHEEWPEIPQILLEDIAAGETRPDPIDDPNEDVPRKIQAKMVALVRKLEAEMEPPR